MTAAAAGADDGDSCAPELGLTFRADKQGLTGIFIGRLNRDGLLPAFEVGDRRAKPANSGQRLWFADSGQPYESGRVRSRYDHGSVGARRDSLLEHGNEFVCAL